MLSANVAWEVASAVGTVQVRRYKGKPLRHSFRELPDRAAQPRLFENKVCTVPFGS
jgi:hypothetical protein